MDKREQYLRDFIWPGNNPQTTLPTAANPKPSYLLPPSFHPSPGPASGPQIPTCLRSACEQAQAEPAGGQDAPDTRSSAWDVCGGVGGGIHLCHTSLHLPLRTDVLWKTPGHTHKPLLVADLEQVGEDRAAGFVKGRVEVTRALRAGEVPLTQRRQETGISETSLLSAGKHHNHPQESCLLAGLAPRKEGLRPQEEGRGSAGQGRP